MECRHKRATKTRSPITLSECGFALALCDEQKRLPLACLFHLIFPFRAGWLVVDWWRNGVMFSNYAGQRHCLEDLDAASELMYKLGQASYVLVEAMNRCWVFDCLFYAVLNIA